MAELTRARTPAWIAAGRRPQAATTWAKSVGIMGPKSAASMLGTTTGTSGGDTSRISWPGLFIVRWWVASAGWCGPGYRGGSV